MPVGVGSQLYNNSVFDMLDINVAYILLNGECYTYADVQSTINCNTREKWYIMYKDFRNYYFGANRDDSAEMIVH